MTTGLLGSEMCIRDRHSPVYLQVAQAALCICKWLTQPCVSAGGSNSPVYLQVAQAALCICRWLKQPCVSAGGSNSPVYLQVDQTAKLKTLIPESLIFCTWGYFLARKDHGGSFSESFLACAFNTFSFVFALVQKLSCASSTLSGPGSVHKGTESGDSCGRAFPGKSSVSSFP